MKLLRRITINVRYQGLFLWIFTIVQISQIPFKNTHGHHEKSLCDSQDTPELKQKEPH